MFREVRIGKNAVVKNSILMQGAVVEENAVLINTILDKYVTVGEGINIMGTKDNPYTVEKDLVI